MSGSLPSFTSDNLPLKFKGNELTSCHQGVATRHHWTPLTLEVAAPGAPPSSPQGHVTQADIFFFFKSVQRVNISTAIDIAFLFLLLCFLLCFLLSIELKIKVGKETNKPSNRNKNEKEVKV